MSTTRTLVSVTAEDASGSGRPLLWGYGVGHIAMIASRSVWTVRADIRAGKLDPTCPFEVVAYALGKRGASDIADAARAALETQT